MSKEKDDEEVAPYPTHHVLDIETIPAFSMKELRKNAPGVAKTLLKEAFQSLFGYDDSFGVCSAPSVAKMEDAISKEFASFRGKTPKELAEHLEATAESRMALHPMLCEIVCVVVLSRNALVGKSEFCVYSYDSNLSKRKTGLSKHFDVVCTGSKADVLSALADRISSDVIVGHRIRNFDNPILMHHAGLCDVPIRNLLPNRFDFSQVMDTSEVLTYFGAIRPSTLEAVCLSMGITSPKDSMSGDMVYTEYKNGKVLPIAVYCKEDVRATGEVASRLYSGWGGFIRDNYKYRR